MTFRRTRLSLEQRSPEAQEGKHIPARQTTNMQADSRLGCQETSRSL